MPGATRCPTATPWLCSPRTRARRSSGSSVTASPTRSGAPISVPVTTGAEAASSRSGGRSASRGGPRAACARPRQPRSSASAARSYVESRAGQRRDAARSGRPRAAIGASSASPPRSAQLRQLRRPPTSILVSATIARVMPSSSQIARCSRVCGITPSSAATTSSTQVDAGRRRPPSCARAARGPGTSTTPSRVPLGEVERREAELDRDAARLLLRQPVGVDAGQRADERGLAVVDVTAQSRGSARPSARSNAVEAGVRAQRLGDRDRAVGLLVVLEQRDQRARDRRPPCRSACARARSSCCPCAGSGSSSRRAW